MKCLLHLLFFLLPITGVNHLSANDINKDATSARFSLDRTYGDCGDADLNLLQENLLSWAVGTLLNENQMLINFDVGQSEFNAFVNRYLLPSLTMNIIFKHDGGAEDLIESVEVVGLGGLDIETWSHMIFNPMTSGGNYYLELVYDTYQCGGNRLLPLENYLPVEEHVDSLSVNLPDYECGDAYNLDSLRNSLTNTTPISSVLEGQVLDYVGFPIEILTITNNPNGTFSGTANVPLPFTSKVVTVDFAEIGINTAGQIFSGELTALGDPLDRSIFALDTFSSTLDICQPPAAPGYNAEGFNSVTGLDDYGFDTSGIHSITGTTYDENGFYQDGTHMDTGSEFNEEGCSRDGKNEQGEPCNPAGNVNPAAKAHVDTIRDETNDSIANILEEILDTYTQSELQQTATCDSLRSNLGGFLAQLGWDSAFVFGKDEEFIKEGMHDEFSAKPTKLNIGLDRNPVAIQMEENHLALYDCDVLLELQRTLKAIIDTISSGAGLQELQDQILDDMSHWSDEQLMRYQDPNEFSIYLRSKIELLLSDELPNEDIGYQESDYQEENWFDYEPSKSWRPQRYSLLASRDPLPVFLDGDDAWFENIFEFEQGFKWIDGVHRAFYVEELARQQEILMTDPGDQLLPLKVSRTVGAFTYTIYLERISFSIINGASLDAVIIIDDPSSDRRMVFSGTDISFGPTGLSGATESRLYLESEVELRVFNGLKLILHGGDSNFCLLEL